MTTTSTTNRTRKPASSNAKRTSATHRRRAAEQTDEELWKGLVAGLVAGAVASLVMNLFQSGMKAVEGAIKQEPQHQDRYPKPEVKGGSDPVSEESKSEAESDPTTVKVAEEISEEIFDHKLTKSEKQTLGPVVHYAFGASVGALYGGLAEYQPSVTTAYGLIYGAAVWAAADETMLPLLGLSKPPDEYPAEVHLKALAAHLVFGLSLELTRQLTRNLLDRD